MHLWIKDERRWPMAGRLDNLKALNTDRWKAHAQSHTDAAAEDDARDRDQLLSAATPAPAPTGGALFNLANPTNDGEFVKPYVRDLDKQAPRYRGELTWIDPKTYERVPMPPGGGKDWMRTRTAVPSSGDDWSSVRLGSVHKLPRRFGHVGYRQRGQVGLPVQRGVLGRIGRPW